MKLSCAWMAILLAVAPVAAMSWLMFFWGAPQNHIEGKQKAAILHGAYFLGPLLAFISLIALAVLFDGLSYRPRWLFVASSSIEIMWLIWFPIGTVLGLSLILYLFFSRKKVIWNFSIRSGKNAQMKGDGE